MAAFRHHPVPIWDCVKLSELAGFDDRGKRHVEAVWLGAPVQSVSAPLRCLPSPAGLLGVFSPRRLSSRPTCSRK